MFGVILRSSPGQDRTHRNTEVGHRTLQFFFLLQICYLGAGRHLRPEENSKNRKIEKKILPLHQKPALLRTKKSLFFGGEGGGKKHVNDYGHTV